MASPDRVALNAMAGTGSEHVGSNGTSREAARAAAIADMPDFDAEDVLESKAAPGPDAAAPEAKTETKVEPTPDPSEAQLGSLKKREARQREGFAAKEAELTKREAEIAERLVLAEKYEALKERMALDPAGAYEEMIGALDDDKALHLTRQFYARTSKAKEQPQHRQLAEQSTKEQAVNARLAAIEKKAEERIASLESKLAAKEKDESEKSLKVQLFTGASSALTDTTPLAKAELAADRDEALEGLARAKIELWDRDEEEPDYADVVAHYEKTLAERYKKRGLTLAQAKAAAVEKTEKAAPSKTLTADMTAGTKASDGRKKTKEELRDEAIRDMPNFDD